MEKGRHLLFGLLLAALTVFPSTADAQHDGHYEGGFSSHFGLNLGGGTEGISVGLGASIGQFVEIGAGVNLMPSFTISGDARLNGGKITIPKATTGEDGQQEYNTYDLSTMTLSGKFERITLDTKLSVYPFGGHTTFFVSGGLSLIGPRLAKISGNSEEVARLYKENKAYADELLSNNEYALSAVIGQSYLKTAETGSVDAEIRVNKVRPYIGLGFGRLTPRHGMGVRFEAGCQFTGHIKVYQDDKQLPIEDLLQKADDRLSKLVDRMTIYPVIRLSVCGTFM